MVEPEVQSSVDNASGGEAAPFESFESLRHAHLELMHSFSDAAAVSNQAPSSADKMRSFIARAHATGAVIDDKNERKAAQGILDYWSTELISAPGATPRDFSPARLAPHDVATAVVTSEAAPAVDTKLQERSREIIRLVASARLWRDSGRQRGYLLHGDALAEAAKYRDQDPDLSELVSASEADVRQRLQNGIAGAGIAITVLLTLLAASTWLWFAESRSSILAESKTAIAESEKRELERALAEAKEALSKSRRNAEEADQLDRRLQATLAVIRSLIQQKVIALDQLPPDIAAQVKTTTAPTVGFAPEKVDAQTTGYNANFFLSVALPLPVLSETAKAAAFDGGRLINYVNYSLVMNAKRRLALFTASNFDRNDRIVLRRSTDRFTLDPRIPRDVQPMVAWFDSTEIDMGHLTSREEISWGPYFRGDETAASQKLGAMINVFTNVAPQFDTFNRGVWSQLERWMLSEHNKKATRVTIFTGPVLNADDPVVGGSPMPRLFWKIAVSPKADGPRGLVVDAFIIAQFAGAKKIGPTRFVPSQFRVRVAEIERLTGLDFGAGIRDAATSDTATAASQEARPNNTVYFQFAGMTREEAIRISNRIQGLGWKIPGEERTPAAANQNEVRYGAEADRPAAELLVADLKSLGLNRVCCAKRNATIKPSILEIWLSR